VQHELGSTSLDAAPQRVVCGTDGGELCSLLALGLKPVGYGRRQDPTPTWLEGLVDGVDSYDLSGGESNFERIAAWAPDLLLVQKGFATTETLPRFTDIAPTVATSFADWRANLRQVGQAVGLEDRATALEAEKDALVQAAKDRLGASAAGLRVNFMMAFDDGSIYVLNEQSPAGKIAAALGLAPLPAPATEGEVADTLSPERLSTVDGDLLVLLHFGDGDGAPALQEKSVYQDLAAVRAGKVVDLTLDESDALYFDSVLTVEPNVALLERLIGDALA
jgi:iron complex transport system substrate-binding protein